MARKANDTAAEAKDPKDVKVENLNSSWSKDTKVFLRSIEKTLKQRNLYDTQDAFSFILLGDSYEIYRQLFNDFTTGTDRGNLASLRAYAQILISLTKEMGLSLRSRSLLKRDTKQALDKAAVNDFLATIEEEE